MDERMRLPEATEVIVVGAGPVGMTLATALAMRGVDVLLLDRQAAGANTSRAAVVHARTLEVLTGLKVTDELVSRGVITPRFTLRDRDRALMTVDFGGLPTAYPYTLMVPQDVTERVLQDRLHEVGGRVHRPYEVSAVTQDATGATVTTGDGQSVRARYVVGADGMHSAVRGFTGINFTGDRYPQSFVLADIRMDWDLPGDEVMLYFSPAGLAVVAPLPGGRHRIVATMDQAPEHPDHDLVQSVLGARGPQRNPIRVREVVWSSRFRVHHRLADRYRAGRLFLAGDAAHVHSPAGGQGMNIGIQDGVALAGRLAAVLRDGAPDRVLDGYETERRPVAARVVALTDRMTRAATTRSVPAQMVRNTALRMLGGLPRVRRAVAMNLSELATDPARGTGRSAG